MCSGAYSEALLTFPIGCFGLEVTLLEQYHPCIRFSELEGSYHY